MHLAESLAAKGQATEATQQVELAAALAASQGLTQQQVGRYACWQSQQYHLVGLELGPDQLLRLARILPGCRCCLLLLLLTA